MAAKLRRSRPKLLILLLAVLIVAGGLYLRNSNSTKSIEHPEYLSFVGNYTFSIPGDMVVDEHTIAGMQVVYSGNVTGKTLDQIYEAGNIAIQPIAPLNDQKASSFKNYVNQTFVPDAKLKLSSDVSVKFEKQNGWDVAKVTIKKGGKPNRFVYLKNGKHPVAVISKDENDKFKKIEQSITDVEETDLKNDISDLKKSVQATAQLLRDKNASELYKQATPDFRSSNTEDQTKNLLAVEEVYSQGAITVNGGSYAEGEFGAVAYFEPLNKDFPAASGAMYFKKVEGQWKLKGMQLPIPTPEKQ